MVIKIELSKGWLNENIRSAELCAEKFSSQMSRERNIPPEILPFTDFSVLGLKKTLLTGTDKHQLKNSK